MRRMKNKVVDYGWLLPEKEVLELHGWAESNINVLTDTLWSGDGNTYFKRYPL